MMGPDSSNKATIRDELKKAPGHRRAPLSGSRKNKFHREKSDILPEEAEVTLPSQSPGWSSGGELTSVRPSIAPMTNWQSALDSTQEERKRRASGRHQIPSKYRNGETEEAEMITPLSPPVRDTSSDEVQVLPGAEAVAGFDSARPHAIIRRSRSAISNISSVEEETASLEVEAEEDTGDRAASNNAAPPNLRAELVHDPPRASVVASDDELQQNLKATKRRIRFYLMVAALVLVLLVVGLTVGLLLSNRSRKTPAPTQAPTAAPTFFRERFAVFIQEESPNTSFEDATSPQSSALEWVSSDEYSLSLADSRVIQRFALATFFYSTGGTKSWNYTSGWLEPNMDECEWVSVECDSANRLIGLRIDQGGLSGTLPEELGLFTSMDYLYLWNNKLSGTLPSELGNIEGIFDIDLGFNHLEGTMPSELGKMTGLLGLWLADNNFDGSIPIEVLVEMTNLQILSLEHNSFVGTISSEVGDLSVNLEEMVLRNNDLNGTVPSEFGMLRRLRVFDLAENAFSGNLPSDLGKLTRRLYYLDLGDNVITGTVPSELGMLTILTVLSLRANKIEGTLPVETILKLRDLRELYLYSNQFEGTIPSDLGQFRGDLLWLHGNNLTGTFPSDFSQLKTLTSLSLFDNGLNGTLPVETILDMTGLTALRLGGNQFKGPIPRDLGQFMGEYLWLDSNELTGTFPLELGAFPNIRLLDLSGNQLSGSVPASFCELDPTPNIHIDCGGDIACGCCLHPYPSSDMC